MTAPLIAITGNCCNTLMPQAWHWWTKSVSDFSALNPHHVNSFYPAHTTPFFKGETS
jgi:hypothetical protein